MRHLKNRTFRLVLALAAVSSAAGAARATDLSLASWVDSVKVSGDFRLRQEQLHYRQDVIDRSRQRYRLRVGLELPLPNGFTAKMRFATGGAEQVSTNQTFGKLSTPETFAVDRAYLEWKAPTLWGVKTQLEGGRMAMPLWTQYSSDIVWDDDYNPEGLGENIESPVFGPVKLFANGLQMVVSEDSKTNRDQFLFSEQIGAEVQLPFETRLKMGYTDHNWVNISTVGVTPSATPINAIAGNPPFGEGAQQDGNRRGSSGLLLNHFRVDEFTGQLSLWVFHVPVALQGSYIRNNGALNAYSPKYNTGYQHGVIVGKASAAKSWELAYFVKSVGTDATVADVADSDFGDNGGTNRKGRIYWAAYNPKDYLQFKVKFFTTQVRDLGVPGSFMKAAAITSTGGAPSATGPKDVNRLQIDMSFKF